MTLRIIRGDTYQYKFQRKNSDGTPILVEADKIFFTVKKSEEDKDFVLQKTIEDMTFDEEGFYHFTIEPEDTDGLKYGDYVYDIEIIMDRGKYKKTRKRGVFKIDYEVTFVENEGGEIDV